MTFSVSGSGESEEEVVESTPSDETPTAPKVPPFREVAGGWRIDLARQIRSELGADKPARLVLQDPHPGGLARLYAERPTKLSSLVRDPEELARAATGAMDVVRQVAQMMEEHGSAVAHLGIGSATWHEGGQIRTVPILLRPVDATLDDDGEVTLTLRPGVEVSNGLLDMLARQGSPVEPGRLLDSVRSPSGFSPSEGIHMIREAGQLIAGLDIVESITFGIFVHPTAALLRELGAPQWLSLSPVARALAGDQGAVAELDVQLPSPNPGDRSPWDERGIGDQTPEAQDVVEAAASCEALLVEAGPADIVGLAASIAADHAANGDQVLVVTGNPRLGERIDSYLSSKGADGFSALVDGGRPSGLRVQEQLKEALLDASDTLNKEELDRVRTDLRRVRTSLADYTTSLHQIFPDWGISAVDALQELTDLTSIPGGPTTTVRLPAPVLSLISGDQGEKARDLLAQASGLGVFAPGADDGPWADIDLDSPDKVQKVLSALVRLHEDYLPAAAQRMADASETTGLIPPKTITKWSEQLEVLSGIRESLDVFRPEIFERSAADMVLATAPKAWLKERGIRLKGHQKRQLVAQAKDLIIPGRYVEDLHGQLKLVQARRETWKALAKEGTWPQLPRELDALIELNALVNADIEVVSDCLQPVYGSLADQEIRKLESIVSELVADTNSAKELPLKVGTLRALDELGLGDLVDDMRERGVDGDNLGLELDLAWWASALGLMLASDPRLGGLDPSALQAALVEERQLDEAQVGLLGPHIRHQVFRHRAASLASGTDTFLTASHAFSVPAAAPSYYAHVPFSWALLPVVITSPTMVPSVVPWGRHIDTLILVGTQRLPLAELIPVIARGRNVIVIADSETDTSRALAEAMPVISYAGAPKVVNPEVVQLLAKYEIESSVISVPSRTLSDSIGIRKVDGTGMPAPGKHAIETSTAEVQAVVDLVLDCLQTENESLAVLALNERHADRIRGALRLEESANPVLVDAMNPALPEHLVVITPQEAGDIQRDHLIVAVGFSKTPHGRVVHDFGPYSVAGGEEILAEGLCSARGRITVVTSILKSDIDPTRLRQAGARMLVDFLEMAERDNLAAGWSTMESAPDHLLVDLAERLYRLGLDVVPNLGSPGGIRIPLAIGHPEVSNELLVAILTDDDEYLKQPSQRVRDRLRPAMLEAQGWRVRTELSMAVFIDPNREAEAIVRMVLDAVDESCGPKDEPVSDSEGEVSLPDEPEIVDVELADVELVGDKSGDVELEVVGEAEGAQLDTEGQFDKGKNGPTFLPVTPAAIAPPAVQPSPDLEVLAAEDLHPERGPRPPIAPGLPLAAYGDDQLDEVAAWVLSGPALSDEEAIEEMRLALNISRRGAQSDLVFANVIRRVRG